MKIETKRLILKSHTMENFEKIKVWMNEPELLYYDDDEPEPFEKKSDERLLKTMDRLISATPEAKKDIIHIAIHKKDDNKLIGYCMIALINNYHKTCKFGITIGDQSEWGKGYGKEILNEVVRYSFEELKMHRIGAEVYSHNPRSISLFENVGFKREGVVRQSILKSGKYVDEYVYGLLKSEWEESKN